MLKITTKKYEIEEEIQLLNENEEVVYSFLMQLTSNDLKELKEALLSKDTLKLASKIKALEKSELDIELTDQVLEMADSMNNKGYEAIGKLCFKEHKEKFIELGGIGKYEEMVEVISDYLLTFFMKKQTTRANTMSSDLAKISQK